MLERTPKKLTVFMRLIGKFSIYTHDVDDDDDDDDVNTHIYI